MIQYFSTKQKDMCWWCGKIADSREHRYKKSDLKRVFTGNKGFDAVISRDDETIYLQGPNSKFVKHEKTICHICNTTRSQPFDHAYDQFIVYVEQNAQKIITDKTVDCTNIFGPDFEKSKQNLLRYYVKHLCCRLTANNISIVPALTEFLHGNAQLQHLYIKFEIRLDLMKWIELNKPEVGDMGNLYQGKLLGYETSQNSRTLDMVYTYYTYRWFKTIFFYSEKITEQNYPGYYHYNYCSNIPVPSLGYVDPVKFKDCTIQEFLDEYNRNSKENYTDYNFIEDTFSDNPFTQFKLK